MGRLIQHRDHGLANKKYFDFIFGIGELFKQSKNGLQSISIFTVSIKCIVLTVTVPLGAGGEMLTLFPSVS